MPLAPPIELDPGWIQRIPPIDAATRLRADRHNRVTPNWIQRDTRALLLAENPTRPCAFTLTRPETDQYMDPWRDVGLSLSPDTRDRHSYAVNNPVSFVDTNGHNCSSGTGTTGGQQCADAWNNHCAKNPGSMYCPKGQSQASGSQMEANDQRVIAGTGGGSNYATNPSDTSVAESTVIARPPAVVTAQLELAKEGRIFQLPGSPYPQALNPWTLGAVNILGDPRCDPACRAYFSRFDTSALAGYDGRSAATGDSSAGDGFGALVDSYGMSGGHPGKAAIGTAISVAPALEDWMSGGSVLRARAMQAVSNEGCLTTQLSGDPPRFDWRNVRATTGAENAHCW